MALTRAFAFAVIALPQVVRGHAAGERILPPLAAARADTVPRVYTDADVKFMQGMMAHHAQALVMAGLLRTRTRSDQMRMLGERIEVSQQDEIAMMRRWLQDRHETAPAVQTTYMPGMSHDMMAGMAMMPGMLTAEQMTQLANANGVEFDRLFLEFMIRHHEGALTMVKDLFGTRGAGQESQMYGYATDIDAEQRAEIARMRIMLKALPAPSITPSKKTPI